jgi:hypothetical protein
MVRVFNRKADVDPLGFQHGKEYPLSTPPIPILRIPGFE